MERAQRPKSQYSTPQRPFVGTNTARMNGKTLAILSAFGVVTIPMLLLNAILIEITAKYAVPGSLKSLHTAVLVNISSTKFATIATWSSTLASIISPFFIILASYPAARSIVQSPGQTDLTRLPTPYQLATMLEIRTGSTYGPEPDGSAGPCTLNPSASNVFLVSSPIHPILVLNNLSSIAVVKRHTQDRQTYQYLAPSDISENLRQDYTAITYGMRSECSPLSKVCHLGVGKIGASTPFNCTRNGFSGAITTSIQLQYYTDPNLSPSTALGVRGFHNPFYFIGAVFLPSQWPAPTDDTEIVSEVHGDRSLILRCSTTVYDITYKVANGSIVHFVPVKSNISATNALQGPIAFTQAADYTLQQAFSFAGSSNSVQEMLDTWATEFDRAAMAMSAAALKGSPATRSQYRKPAIVARIPLAPLVCLLIANMLFAVAGFVLAWMAVVAGRNQETQEVVERMTAVGVVADSFERPQQARRPVDKPEMMFEELTGGQQRRVGVEGAEEGGYRFRTFSRGVENLPRY
ncbi:hypothetical protein FBEOM_11190 [Fusarium beomiforme]|uniref:Uncharacterized protein n=1 Tax=Fusarium beomiforme TaxID=44412 RepID=A0A9P5DUM8_9HYPO|nr:hypothetical protein FBEOM_11190 [Fusarium beomiforme]